MSSSRLRSPTVRAVGVAVAVALVALVATGAIVGGVLADDHTRHQAPHYGPDEEGNATFEFLEQADHHPGAENVSVRYTLKGGVSTTTSARPTASPRTDSASRPTPSTTPTVPHGTSRRSASTGTTTGTETSTTRTSSSTPGE